MKSTVEPLKRARQERGQISIGQIEPYFSLSAESLLELLYCHNAQKRTIGATIIGIKHYVDLILPLCVVFKNEKCLYTRIVMSEALGKLGEPAIIPLISLLGRIGNNQEKALPEKYFNKKSYPLPRDLAARTLVKIGTVAIPELLVILKINDGFEAQQAIDALGNIASNTKDSTALPTILRLLDEYSNNKLMLWKLVRALSGFKFNDVIEPLIKVYKLNPEPPLRWEIIRTIGQIGIPTSAVIKLLTESINDNNAHVRLAAKIAMKQILRDD